MPLDPGGFERTLARLFLAPALMVYKMDMTWMLGPALKSVAERQKSVAAFPNIKTGEEFAGNDN